MRNWIKRNLKNIIVTAFIVPILLVALVSISHVTSFYGISNPKSWALYLSIGIEIAALSALAAVSVRMGKFIYIPFIIVTVIQMVGNIFFSFSYIDENSELFKDWISMVGGLFENIGVEATDIPSHKFILSFLTGGLLPIISLTFAHMLVKYSEQNNNEESVEENGLVSLEDYEKKKQEYIKTKIQEEEKLRYKPTQDDLKKFEQVLSRYETKGEQEQKHNYRQQENKNTYYSNQKQGTGKLDENFLGRINKAFQDLGSGMKSLNNLTQAGKKDKPQAAKYVPQKSPTDTVEQMLAPKIAKTIQNDNEELKKKLTDEPTFVYESPVSVVESNETEILETPKKEDIEYVEIAEEPKKEDIEYVEIAEETKKEDIEYVEIVEETKKEDIEYVEIVEEPKKEDIEYFEIVEEPKKEVLEQLVDEEPQEITPQPIFPDPKYKILKYFKNSD